MNMDHIEGNWKQIKGSVKQHWGKLTNDYFIAMEGKRDQIDGINQVSYSRSLNTAVKQNSAWQQRVK